MVCDTGDVQCLLRVILRRLGASAWTPAVAWCAKQKVCRVCRARQTRQTLKSVVLAPQEGLPQQRTLAACSGRRVSDSKLAFEAPDTPGDSIAETHHFRDFRRISESISDLKSNQGVPKTQKKLQIGQKLSWCSPGCNGGG